jgi:hypothetical protein
MLSAGVGVLRPHHDAIREQVEGTLELGELAATQAEEQGQAAQGAQAAEVTGRLPQRVDLVIAQAAPARWRRRRRIMGQARTCYPCVTLVVLCCFSCALF